IDPNSGRWLKDPANGEDDDGMGDPGEAPPQRIVPMVQDHKNALLLKPAQPLSVDEMATLQHAFVRGIQLVFELEEGEILGEPLPTRDQRNVILFYEATEGGAGVLNRLVSDPEKVAEVAHACLELMHYKPPFAADAMVETDDPCVAGCYRCILSYYNQPDHELINRRLPNVIDLLCRLTKARLIYEGPSVHQSGWVAALARWGMPTPSPVTLNGAAHELYWPSHGVLAVPGGASEELTAAASAVGILDIVSLDAQPGAEPPPALISALGVTQ
ncbi:DUF1998 domain-containing protein, partial [Thermaurantiacus sp.]